jgi:hypothetical protein
VHVLALKDGNLFVVITATISDAPFPYRIINRRLAQTAE